MYHFIVDGLMPKKRCRAVEETSILGRFILDALHNAIKTTVGM